MNRGKRMLNAQERREQFGDDDGGDGRGLSSTSTSARSSALAYLRSDRAFDADGTPNRPNRRRTSLDNEDGTGELPALEANTPPLQEGGKHRRSRSRTPPSLLASATGRRAPAPSSAGLSPQRFVPPGLQASGVSPQRWKRNSESAVNSSATGSEVAPKESRATPRRRTTRNYPIERVSAALSSVDQGRAASLSPTKVPRDVRATGQSAAAPKREESPVAPAVEGIGGSASASGEVTSSHQRAQPGHVGLQRPPSLPPLAPAKEASRGAGAALGASTQSTPGFAVVTTTSAADARVPMPSPPLRAIVSPRMGRQHLSRVNSVASQSCSQFPGSCPSTPPVGAVNEREHAVESRSHPESQRYAHHPHRGSPAGSPSWALPAPALSQGEIRVGVLGVDVDEESQDGGAEAEPGDVRHPPSFPSAPMTYLRHDGVSDAAAAGDCDTVDDDGVASCVTDVNSGGPTGLEAYPSSATPPATTVLTASHPDSAVPGAAGHLPASREQASTLTPHQEPTISPSPPSPEPAEGVVSTLRIPDYSGFHNRGNDCYACSVLTVLLRSQTFRKALCASPLLVAARNWYGIRPPRVSSGYLPDAAVYAPNRVGGGFHRLPSLSPMPSTDSDSDDEEVHAETSKRHRSRDALVLSEDGAVEPSVHGQLEELLEEVWRKERLIYRVNDNVAEDEESRRLLFRKYVAHCARRSSEGVEAYRFGVNLRFLARHFAEEFFTGEQEDAHEFFVSIVGKLELEAEQAEKRRAEARSLPSPATDDKARRAQKCRTEHSDDEVDDNAKGPTSLQPLLPSVWVNRLMQGKLLNIVRCRNPSCHHHIATEEPYVNLSVTLAAQKENEPLRPDESVGSEPPLLSQLLFQSLQYGKLDEYVCDACGSKARQFQGACFYMEPPPILVVQLKRFAIQAGLNELGVYEVTVTKDRSEVHVEDFLEVYSLPRNGAGEGECYYHGDTNQLGRCVLEAESRTPPAQTCTAGQRDPNHHGERDSEMISATRSVYQLRGTVLHLGRLLNCGHYVSQFAVVPSSLQRAEEEEEAAGKATTGSTELSALVGRFPPLEEITKALPPLQWKLADDAVVRQLNTEDLARQRRHCDRSYLLSYEKVFEERVRVPVWKVLPTLDENEEASSASGELTSTESAT